MRHLTLKQARKILANAKDEDVRALIISWGEMMWGLPTEEWTAEQLLLKKDKNK